MSITRSSLLRFVASGLVGGTAAVALAQPQIGPAKTVNVSGATLLENFVRAPGSTNDFINANSNVDGGARIALSYLGPVGTEQLAPQSLPPAGINGYWSVIYRSVGSIRGFQEMVDFGRTFVETGDADAAGLLQSVANQAFFNGRRFAQGSNDEAGNNDNNPGGAPIRSVMASNPGCLIMNPAENPLDANYLSAIWTGNTGDLAGTCPNAGARGGLRIDMAVVDVPATWAVLNAVGTPAAFDTPTQPGYGNNARTTVDKNTGAPVGFSHKLAVLSAGANLYDGIPANADANTIFDTQLTFAPIAVLTSYGTGIQQMDKSDVRHFFVTGRRLNGENLHAVTRDSGSGTRNAFNNTTGTDPSFGVGENVGGLSANAQNDLIGPNFLPGNKGGNPRIEDTVINSRLGIGYAGAERGINNGWLDPNRAEIVAIRNDLVSPAGTQYARPHIANIVNNSTADSYRVGGPAVFSHYGDPRAEAPIDGGANWPLFQWNDDPRPVRPSAAICPPCNDPQDPQFDLYKNATPPAAEPATGTPRMRNVWAARYINNITRSAEQFIRIPGGGPSVFSPGEVLAVDFILSPALDFVPGPLTPLSFVPNSGFSTDLKNYTLANNVLSNARYLSFNTLGAGRWPQRTVLGGGNRYSDGNSGANNYRNQNGLSVGGTGALALRNKISGDFDGNGLRNLNDTAEMLRAFRDRINRTPDGVSSTTPWTPPAGTGADPIDNGINGAAGGDAVIEVLGDFNSDGNFGRIWNINTNAFDIDRSDVRYFADGLAIDPITGKLDRQAGFQAVDDQWAIITGNNNFFGVVPATAATRPGFAYVPGTAAADVIGPSGNTARGWTPLGADGRVDNRDIDYIFRQFKQAGITGDADWSDTIEAALFDLSADVTGDLKVNQDDVDRVVRTLLQTSFADINLDGFTTNSADRNVLISNLGTAGGWASGDLDGDGQVTLADLTILDNNRCQVDFNDDGFLNQEDLAGFIAAFLDESVPAGPSGTSNFRCSGTLPANDPLANGFAADFNLDCNFDQEDLSGYITSYFNETESPTNCIPG